MTLWLDWHIIPAQAAGRITGRLTHRINVTSASDDGSQQLAFHLLLLCHFWVSHTFFSCRQQRHHCIPISSIAKHYSFFTNNRGIVRQQLPPPSPPPPPYTTTTTGSLLLPLLVYYHHYHYQLLLWLLLPLPLLLLILLLLFTTASTSSSRPPLQTTSITTSFLNRSNNRLTWCYPGPQSLYCLACIKYSNMTHSLSYIAKLGVEEYWSLVLTYC